MLLSHIFSLVWKSVLGLAGRCITSCRNVWWARWYHILWQLDETLFPVAAGLSHPMVDVCESFFLGISSEPCRCEPSITSIQKFVQDPCRIHLGIVVVGIYQIPKGVNGNSELVIFIRPRSSYPEQIKYLCSKLCR